MTESSCVWITLYDVDQDGLRSLKLAATLPDHVCLPVAGVLLDGHITNVEITYSSPVLSSDGAPKHNMVRVGLVPSLYVEDFSAEGFEPPADGSRWTHHNGNVYQVERLTNDNTKDASKYPTTVVYFNAVTGAWYSRPLSRWYASMTPVTA